MTVKTINRTIVAPGFEAPIVVANSNGDGYACIKLIPKDGGSKQFAPAFCYVDNHI